MFEVDLSELDEDGSAGCDDCAELSEVEIGKNVLKVLTEMVKCDDSEGLFDIEIDGNELWILVADERVGFTETGVEVD